MHPQHNIYQEYLLTYVPLKGHYPRLVFHFELKRSILYFILETYVPSSLLVVLSWVSFWISLSSVPARICIGMLQKKLVFTHMWKMFSS